MKRLFIAAVCAAALGCGDDAASPDASAMDGGPDVRPFGECVPVAPGEPPRGPGACCATDTDCATGFCLGGWCSRTCAADSDCMPQGGIATPTPFPQGTQLHCVKEPAIGIQGYCWPGSAQPCDGSSSSCPSGEACGVWFSGSATLPDGGPVPGGLEPRCITRYATARQLATGERCDFDDVYGCANPVGLFRNCIGGACTQGCQPGADGGVCPAGTECFGGLAVELRSTSVVYEGAGLCLGPSCGHLQFSNSPSDVQYVAPPDTCGNGRYCAPFDFKNAAFDDLQLLCATADRSSGAAPGSACQQDRKLNLKCQDELNCLEEPPAPDLNGAPCSASGDCPGDQVCVTPQGQYAGGGALGTCSPRPVTDGFCSVMCRNDGDCEQLPDGSMPFGALPVCLETSAGRFPNGAAASLPFCFSLTQAFDGAPLPFCSRELDCAAQPHTSCIPISNRSGRSFCATGQPGDPIGQHCPTANLACGVDSICLRAADGELHCTNLAGMQQLGGVCQNSAGGNNCASGTCWDRRAQAPTLSSATTRCAAACRSTRDCCAAGQPSCTPQPGLTCVPLRLHDNGTPDPSDDTVMGFCLTQTPEVVAQQCTSDPFCVSFGHGDKCNATTQACYSSTAHVGDACSNDGDCPDGDTCLGPPLFPAFAGGYCVRYGCDLTTITTDNGGCPQDARCIPQGGGTGTCMKACALPGDCRSGYSCDTTSGTCQPM